MTIAVQQGFWGLNRLMARMERVLKDAYEEDHAIGDNPRQAMIAVWVSEGLKDVLGDKFEAFRDFFLGCTTPETISRACRKLKAEGHIVTTEENLVERRQQQATWRDYMRSDR
jgi:hypothetical protein